MAAIAGAAKSAGGASSSMKIKGSMDTANIERGFARTKKGFEGAKGQAKSFGSDMMRVSMTVGRLAKKLVFMGIAGATAMVGIASKAPAVAPAMAKMSVAFGKITRSLGEALAPAFEKVAGWLDKLAVWVDTNKGSIGEMADKFLDWGAAIGEKVWPYLEKIGTWAVEHPGLFAGIVAGLALAPTVISGIATITTLVGLISGATVSASLLAVFGYIAAIGVAAVVTYKAVEAMVSALQKYTGMDKPLMEGGGDGSGQTLMRRLPQQIWADVTGTDAPWDDVNVRDSPANDQFMRDYIANGGSGATDLRIDAANPEDRRAWFLQWWDAVWG